MRDPMIVFGAFLAGLIVAGWLCRSEVRLAREESRLYREALRITKDTCEMKSREGSR